MDPVGEKRIAGNSETAQSESRVHKKSSLVILNEVSLNRHDLGIPNKLFRRNCTTKRFDTCKVGIVIPPRVSRCTIPCSSRGFGWMKHNELSSSKSSNQRSVLGNVIIFFINCFCPTEESRSIFDRFFTSRCRRHSGRPGQRSGCQS